MTASGGRTRLGMLTPSSNTVLEPVCAAMLRNLPEVTAHFARFRVTEISLRGAALDQFAGDAMLRAAELLADARVHAICWNGTSAGWLGLESDRALCRAVTARTGVPATSSVLALDEIFRRMAVKRFGLVTPYVPEVQQRIAANFADAGYHCIAERGLAISENFAFAATDENALTAMIRAVAAERPDAITVFCTNLRAAPLVEALEQEIGIPIYDTVATAVWSSLRLTGLAPSMISGWGRLFREIP